MVEAKVNPLIEDNPQLQAYYYRSTVVEKGMKLQCHSCLKMTPFYQDIPEKNSMIQGPRTPKALITKISLILKAVTEIKPSLCRKRFVIPEFSEPIFFMPFLLPFTLTLTPFTPLTDFGLRPIHDK